MLSPIEKKETNTELEETLRCLEYRHLNTIYAKDREEACQKMLDLIPKKAVVGIGDSTTVRQVRIKDELKKRGTKVLDGYDHHTIIRNEKEFHDRNMLIEQSTVCDVFLTGTNAVTLDGKLVNLDGHCNRVAGMIWGHPLVVVVVGKNKIVKNLDEAFQRVRYQIAPTHLGLRGKMRGRPVDAPCAQNCECNDCRCEDRRCNVWTIIEGRPSRVNLNVVVVNEDLGLGWDETWPQERINNLMEGYRKFAFHLPLNYGRKY